MKTITIGRGEGCDILVDDYRISRRHAILRIHTLGKMEIVDMGQNGTWVNGVKLRPGVPFPVTRKDVVNFADASQLNWSLVDNPLGNYKIIGLIVGILAIVIILIGLISRAFSEGSSEMWQSVDNPVREEQSVNPILGNDSVIVNVKTGTGSNNTYKKAKNDKEKVKTIDELFPTKDKEKEVKEKKEDKKKRPQQKVEKTKKENRSYDIL